MNVSIVSFRVAAVLSVTFLANALHGQQTPTQKPAEKFQVYTWNCSRSIRMTLSTNDLQQAFNEVDKAKKEGRNVRVTTNLQNDSLGVRSEPKGYQIFARSCRGGWRLREKAATAQQAEQLAASITGEGSDIVMVSNYGIEP